MAIGIAGDTLDTYKLIEARVISNLLQTLLGTNQAIDELNVLRNDQAQELGYPQPVPGTTT